MCGHFFTKYIYSCAIPLGALLCGLRPLLSVAVKAPERSNERRSALLRAQSQTQHAEAFKKNQARLTGSRAALRAVEKAAACRQPKLSALTCAVQQRSVSSEARGRARGSGLIKY